MNRFTPYNTKVLENPVSIRVYPTHQCIHRQTPFSWQPFSVKYLVNFVTSLPKILTDAPKILATSPCNQSCGRFTQDFDRIWPEGIKGPGNFTLELISVQSNKRPHARCQNLEYYFIKFLSCLSYKVRLFAFRYRKRIFSSLFPLE